MEIQAPIQSEGPFVVTCINENGNPILWLSDSSGRAATTQFLRAGVFMTAEIATEARDRADLAYPIPDYAVAWVVDPYDMDRRNL